MRRRLSSSWRAARSSRVSGVSDEEGLRMAEQAVRQAAVASKLWIRAVM